MPFGLWIRVGQRMYKFNRIRQVAPMCPHRMAHLRHLANMIETSVCGGDAALCQTTLTTCFLFLQDWCPNMTPLFTGWAVFTACEHGKCVPAFSSSYCPNTHTHTRPTALPGPLMVGKNSVDRVVTRIKLPELSRYLHKLHRSSSCTDRL